jgi:2-alkenal reductase
MNHSNKFKKSIALWLALLPIFALACSITIPAGDWYLPSVTQEAQQPQPTRQTEPEQAPQAGAQPPQEVEALPTPTVGPTPTTLPIPDEIINQETLLTNLYARIHPSVVFITVYGQQEGLETALGQGSGFVYDDQGHIVTNAHVVHGSDQVEVTFYNDVIRIAEVIGEDLNADLAIVRVDLPEGIGPLPLADMNNLAVGQTVIAVGNPFGLEGTLTQGVISALGRAIPALTGFSIPQAIQTDAAINPGNSGGPLLNLRGEVIGVNAQIQTGGQTSVNSGVGFAIPVSIVQRVVPDLIQNGRHAWTWMGIRSSQGGLDPFIVEAMNLPVDRGVYIASVESGGPADQAGLRGSTGTDVVNGRQVEVGGDVITAVDGQPINTFEDLLVYLALNTEPGQPITLTIVRDGQNLEVPVSLEERPENIEEFVP